MMSEDCELSLPGLHPHSHSRDRQSVTHVRIRELALHRGERRFEMFLTHSADVMGSKPRQGSQIRSAAVIRRTRGEGSGASVLAILQLVAGNMDGPDAGCDVIALVIIIVPVMTMEAMLPWWEVRWGTMALV